MERAVAVEVDRLTMTYRTPVRGEGIGAAVRSLLRREYREVRAVGGVSFVLGPGEVVGFIGPNGAGKTTTLKMLCGVLHPTGGTARVLGFVPWRREPSFLRRIALIRGSQPLGGPGELTVMDALRFQQLVYDLPDRAFRANLAELADLLELAGLLERQVRGLSLGERMRCGLALSLLYRPRVLFLDEPTIGLDVSAVAAVRRFVADYAAGTGATVLLTSHYMADVEALCRRIILIDRGELRYDGDLAGLAATLAPYKLVKVAVTGVAPEWSRFGEVVAADAAGAWLRVRREEVPVVAAHLLAELSVADLSVVDPPLEAVLDRVYREGAA
ncbi:MAG TPA: ATP-binding cassette domain-containing protein [Chloroflexota bacterium]